MKLDKAQIEALGHFLTWYGGDLVFFREFQGYVNGKTTVEQYSSKFSGSFQDFIDAYQVSRTLEKGKTERLLEICKNWHDAGRWLDINELAEAILNAGIVHGRPVSLASKVMFLMRPDVVLPYDRRAKTTLGMGTFETDYKEFHRRALEFEANNRLIIDEGLERVSDMLKILERGFDDLELPLQQVSRLRLLDKLLWTAGG